MHEPERGGENFLHLLADICRNDRFVEDGHALRALKLSAFTENRERVLWISGVPKERSEEAAVVLQDFQLGMEHHAEALAKAGLPFPLFTRLLGVNTLHLFGISGNDRFLAAETGRCGARRNSHGARGGPQ